jgi:hypothetical protein
MKWRFLFLSKFLMLITLLVFGCGHSIIGQDIPSHKSDDAATFFWGVSYNSHMGGGRMVRQLFPNTNFRGLPKWDKPLNSGGILMSYRLHRRFLVDFGIYGLHSFDQTDHQYFRAYDAYHDEVIDFTSIYSLKLENIFLGASYQAIYSDHHSFRMFFLAQLELLTVELLYAEAEGRVPFDSWSADLFLPQFRTVSDRIGMALFSPGVGFLYGKKLVAGLDFMMRAPVYSNIKRPYFHPADNTFSPFIKIKLLTHF